MKIRRDSYCYETYFRKVPSVTLTKVVFNSISKPFLCTVLVLKRSLHETLNQKLICKVSMDKVSNRQNLHMHMYNTAP
jgi:hypothetical protein